MGCLLDNVFLSSQAWRMKKRIKSTTLEEGDFPFLHWSFSIIIHSIAKRLNGDAISLFLTPSMVFWNDFFPWRVFLPHTWVRLSHNSLHLVGGLHKITCRGGRGVNCRIKHFKHFLLITQPLNYFSLSKINQNSFYVGEGSSQNNWDFFIILHI